MRKITKWLVELYMIAVSELKYLTELKKQTESNREKARINELTSFNILLMLVYSVFLLGSIVYVVLSLFFVTWYGFVALVVTIPMMALAKTVQKKRYLKRRDAYIKEDESLIKYD